MMASGTRNWYTCKNKECDHIVGYIHRDAGTTPTLVHCDKCFGMLQSTGYVKPKKSWPVPTREWYSPSGVELASIIEETLVTQFSDMNRDWRRSDYGKKALKAKAGAMLKYVQGGGLLERPIRHDLLLLAP